MPLCRKIFAPQLENNEEALKCIMEAITRAGYIPGEDVKLALDVAASELYEEATNTFSISFRQTLTFGELNI